MAITEDDKETLTACLELYKEQCTHGRHTEAQRQLVATFLFTAAGALVAVMGTLHFSIHCLPIAILLFCLGVFGYHFVRIYEIKWTETSERRNDYRTKIQKILPGTEPTGANATHGTLRQFWRRAFIGVWIVGVVCFLIVCCVVYTRSLGSSNGICDSQTYIRVAEFLMWQRLRKFNVDRHARQQDLPEHRTPATGQRPKRRPGQKVVEPSSPDRPS